MGIRIQPREIYISTDPADDPFENDLLDRKEKAEVLTSLVRNIEGPCTMAVDAAWGAGKTTFLKMWAQHLRNEGFPTVEFNAWETDASGDPFVALTSEITQGLKEWPDGKVSDRLHQTEFLARQVFRRVAPGAIRLAAGFIPVVGSEVGNALGSYVGEAMAGYTQEQRSASQYKSSLQVLAATVWESSKGKPVVILIDELDRCRPTYAIELLETAKHIFGVDHVVFVLAVNRAELAHSVKALYGSEFGADGYLRRFFDIDFRLPVPDRQTFIQNTLTLNGVHDFLDSSSDRFAKSQVALDTLTSFFAQSELTLRDIGQAIHRLSVVVSSLEKNEHVYFRTLTVLLILRAIDQSVYQRFVDGESTAQQTINFLFGETNYAELRNQDSGRLVEAVIIAARITREYFFREGENAAEFVAKVPLFFQYREAATKGQMETYQDEDTIHAINIIRTLQDYFSVTSRPSESLGFQESVQRLEIFSPDLISADPA